MAEPSLKQRAWPLFDRIVADAVASPLFEMGPWNGDEYIPDIATLQKLLGVPRYLNANSQSGVPALALDVWVAYELRRAGFAADAVWPRAAHPRVMPAPVANYLASTTKELRGKVGAQMARLTPMKGVVATDAKVLGRHYIKQVDVVMSAWETGPEVLISTKRMDSSFGKNAANRIEEAYGDAKNLRSRHPLAAHGFVYGLRSTILESEPDKARWLIDLLGKLAQEDDAYDAVCLLMLHYEGAAPEGSEGGHEDEDDVAATELTTEIEVDEEDILDEEVVEDVLLDGIDEIINELPSVSVIEHRDVPASLGAAAFLKQTVEHVLRATPITMHRHARVLHGWPVGEDPAERKKRATKKAADDGSGASA
ncbi:hypothetical protein FM104_13090 [Microbacterium esteraromaticum]|uniref:Uncharacterized protein n=1 Tax=Microbacterium esteraromaticum TaxID=57043 RepID=A0A1R4KI28_9MICO|nr:hypothetical protein [Microbacterium esteraromaticum]SJN43991.1 hypothetical protein FM104_13090 [Microbacterium esteraromaticum]